MGKRLISLLCTETEDLNSGRFWIMLRGYSENFRISLLPDAPEVAEMHEMLQMFLNYDIHFCFINRQYDENRIQTLNVSLTVRLR
jgi:hypothetical protein